MDLCDVGALFRRFRLDNRENGAKLVMQQTDKSAAQHSVTRNKVKNSISISRSKNYVCTSGDYIDEAKCSGQVAGDVTTKISTRRIFCVYRILCKHIADLIVTGTT